MLQLPPKFKRALGSGVRTSLFPLVVIGSDIRLSIKETSIDGESYDALLLSSPSIKSSADIINNKYTISSVSLSISNAMYHGKMFSDTVHSLLNEETKIYYCANGINELDDCLLVYTGKIRRYSQSAETIKLTLEDLTEEKLTTKVPATLVDDQSLYREKDIGKPYPMVYGKVANVPLIQNNENKLEADKPNQQIDGHWSGNNNIEFGNDYVNGNHPLLQYGWLKELFYLSIYSDNGFIPLTKEIVKNWGSRTYEALTEGDSLYEWEDASQGISAGVKLVPEKFMYESYVLDENDELEGVGKKGIPARIYRPIIDVSFFALNHSDFQKGTDDDGNAYRMANSSNKFFGFADEHIPGAGDGWNDTKWKYENIYMTEHDQIGIPSGLDNSGSPMQDAYNANWGNTGYKNWWEASDVNDNSGVTDEDGVWSYTDFNWETEFGDGNGRFPVDYIQNHSQYTGIHLTAQNPVVKDTGGFARFLIAQNIGDFKCVTKILHFTEYFVDENQSWSNVNIHDHGFYASWHPARFWITKELPQDGVESVNNHYASSYNHTRNAWQNDYDTEDWTTMCEYPNWNHDNLQVIDEGTNEYAIRPYWDSFPYKGDDYDNIILGFDSTNSYDSIQWGAVNSRASTSAPHYMFRTIANLKEVYILQDYLVQDVLEKDFYCDVSGRTDDGSLVDSPDTILKHILEEELLYDDPITMDHSGLHQDWQFAFAATEQKEAKQIFQDLFKSSLLIPSFDSEGHFRFITLKQTISASDQSGYPIINNQDILKYSFELSKLDDVYSSVNVKYKKNYASGDFDAQTGFTIQGAINEYDSYQDLTESNYSQENEIYDVENYYKLSPEDTKLDVETEYIREESTARRLQKRLLMWHINQHLITKIDLPTHYMYLEAGDYIKFDELVGGKLAFGYDYTQTERRNGQLIYPVFFITKVSKSLTKVSIEAIQIHRGEYGFPADDDNDAGDIINSEKVDVTDQFQLPNPYNDPNYNDGSVNKEEYQGGPDQPEDYYFNLSINGNTTLNNGHVSALVNTNIDDQWRYNIWIRTVSSTDGYIAWYDDAGEYHRIDNGEFEVGEQAGEDLIYHNRLESGNDAIIHLSKKYAIFPDGAVVEFIIQAKTVGMSLQDSMEAFGYFDQFGERVEPLQGDLNNDNIINVLDVVILLQIILDENSEYSEDADLNDDGINNINDVIIMINMLLEN